MGASQGKSKKEQKEEARDWARTKENEVAELYAQNTELRNQILMMQEDMRALRDMLKGTQSALNESVKQMEERMTEMESSLRDMLKGQQSVLNESVKQMTERMTEMENDVKVVPFCGYSGSSLMPLSSISSAGEQEVYYRNEINDENDHRAWEKEEKRQTYTTSYMRFGRVYSLKQFEKVYVDEWKFKKITVNQYGEKRRKWNSQGYNGYVHGLPKGETHLLFPSPTYVTGNANDFFKHVQVEPDEE